MNIFERATRQKLRFDSPIGQLTIEQLWELPLRAKRDNQADLDKITRVIAGELKALGEDSFVDDTDSSPAKTLLTLKLDVCKRIIEVRKGDIKTAETRAANTEQRRKLQEALAAKQDQKLQEMSEEDLQRALAEVS